MLSKASWLPLAEKLDLPDGRSRRVDHDCGSGRTLKVSRHGNKLDAYCWRCNDSGFHFAVESTAERISRLASAAQADDTLRVQTQTPEGERNPLLWPDDARLWLLRAGLSSHDVGRLGARFVPHSHRVVLPAGDNFWIARAIKPGQQPKYMAPNVDKSRVLPRYGTADRITLNEDILSAYKVGQVAEGWAMMGTSLSPYALSLILASGKGVNVWLDNDLPPLHLLNRGQIAARKVVKQLRSYGVDVRNIVTDRDPKLLRYDDIKEVLK